MRQISFFVLTTISILLISSCARVYYSPEAVELCKSHERIAILPPYVAITSSKLIDPETLRLQQESESLRFQKEMVSWMLMQRGQFHVRLNIQDIETTNALLKQAWNEMERDLTSQEICDLLQVDALLRADFNMHRPMSDGAAVAIGVFTGIWATTNEIEVYMDLFDKSTDQVIWNYNRTMSGSVLNSVNRMIDELMYHAFGKMPYSKKK